MKQADSSLYLKKLIEITGNKPLLKGCEMEHKFHPTRKWRFDFAWVDLKIALECDGGQFKTGGGRHNSDSDREKLNNAALLGWRVVRFSARQIYANPEKCIKFIKEILQSDREKLNNSALLRWHKEIEKLEVKNEIS